MGVQEIARIPGPSVQIERVEHVDVYVKKVPCEELVGLPPSRTFRLVIGQACGYTMLVGTEPSLLLVVGGRPIDSCSCGPGYIKGHE